MDKFVPQSPDPFLKKPEDMSLAKFGHLNALVTELTGAQLDIATLDQTLVALNAALNALAAADVAYDNTASGLTAADVQAAIDEVTALASAPVLIPSGIFGISNSAGVYTYYSQFNDAVLACPIGGTIEQFADYVNTFDDGNGSYQTITKSLNFNMNGHSFRNSISGSYPLSVLAAASDVINISNGKIDCLTGYNNETVAFDNATVNLDSVIIASNIVGSYTLILTNATVHGGLIINTSATGNGVTGGTLIGTKVFVSGSGTAIGSSTNVKNCYGFSESGTGITIQSTFAENSIGASTSGTGFRVNDYGRVSGCRGVSGSGVGFILGNGNAIHCSGFSSGNIGVEITAGFNSSMTNIQSLSGYGGGTFPGIKINITAGTHTIRMQGLIAVSEGGVGMEVVKTTGGLVVISNADVYSKYDNVAGHAVSLALSGGASCTIAQSTLTVSNTGANCVYAAAATDLRYGQLIFIGATTSVNANVTQTMGNVPDAQGNLVI